MKTEDIKLFHIVVDSSSLVRAAELLNLPKSNVSRRIKALEQEIDTHLFHRSARALKLTEKGQLFYSETKAMVSQLDGLLERLSHNQYELSGHLRIQVLPLPEVLNLTDLVHQFMELHPKVTVEIITSSHESNLIENHIDVALRIGRQLEDSTLIARPVNEVIFGCYASPSYLANIPMPTKVADLEQLQVIRWRLPNGKLARDFYQGNLRFNTPSRLTVNHPEHLIQAAVKGKGLIMYPKHLVANLVSSGELVEILPEKLPLTSFSWLVYPTKKSLSNTATKLVEYIVDQSRIQNPKKCPDVYA
ncbi:LysR family transcriptional regulator [Ferrimonas lipolytica]|uniref:LysR family transcriptional regulator n=1 Tax=Ferrimonas lipolytica TaxID=2724191 RepID=A0A6H1UCS1_9GAMM|nr:LysR family transcriptional regulator [Ferrimonas lipolytica]QIZ76638.1 LysR family transcriptional regulator [Ferrimonas lipolytica]